MLRGLARLRRAILLGLALAGAGCAAGPARDAHVPPFARVPFEPFSRRDSVAIALREWRAFGSRVNDTPPGETRSEGVKAEREPGMWQRVGEYWWLGQDADRPDAAWTGRHDASGAVFPEEQDGEHAWSAAFVSYVLRSAGARGGFPYAAAHWVYIDAARTGAAGLAIRAEPPTGYAPRPGDLVCMGRLSAQDLRFEDLPAGRFPAHCDVVVEAAPGELTVVGGNVEDAVTMRHVPLTADGRLAGDDGRVVDDRFPWFVVIRVLYDD